MAGRKQVAMWFHEFEVVFDQNSNFNSNWVFFFLFFIIHFYILPDGKEGAMSQITFENTFQSFSPLHLVLS